MKKIGKDGESQFNTETSEFIKISQEIADIKKDIANIIDEINLIHKSVANLRPDTRQAMREELIRSRVGL